MASPHLPNPPLWSRDLKMQSTESLLATDVDTLFSSVKREGDLSANYAGTKINRSCELIPQHGNLSTENPTEKDYVMLVMLILWIHRKRPVGFTEN